MEVPGASFRFYQLQIPGNHSSMLEPVKLHQSLQVDSGTSLYFKAPANRAFRLCGKNYGGPDGLIATALDGSGSIHLELPSYAENEYPRFDCTSILASANTRIYQLGFDGSGKISFWLDDIPNLFAQQPGQLFDLQPADAATQISIGAPIGNAPAVGAALPFAEPPASSYSLLDGWGLKSTNFYFFQDTLEKNIDADKRILDTYQNRFKLQNAVTILSNTGRQPLIEDTSATADFLQRYLKRRHEDGLLNNAYVAFSDEPNLNYSDLDEFESQFVSLATTLKQSADPAVRSTLIAAPQSSRFWNGPTRDDAASRRGSDMAERLLSQHYNLFDAISWHEWQIRDLIATDWYFDSINRAWQLMKRYQPAGQPEKKLIIGQTNISSGYSLSPYEQDSFFAALWWTSVVAQSARTGKLSSLVWFKAADDGLYNKGLVSLTSSGYDPKPASAAMSFVTAHLGERVLQTQSSHPELDAVATLDAGNSLKVLGVNKGERVQHLTLNLPRSVTSIRLYTLNESGSQSTRLVIQNNRIQIDLPPRTLFAIDEEGGMAPPSPPTVAPPRPL